MEPKSIFYPVLALVAFTFILGLRLFRLRIQIVKQKRISSRALRDGKNWEDIFREAEDPSDAYENLFEIPVLFYAVVLAVYVTGQVNPFYVIAAWVFVFFRILQGVIHCTYNHVTHRATAYFFGCFTVIGMWAGFAIGLFRS